MRSQSGRSRRVGPPVGLEAVRVRPIPTSDTKFDVIINDHGTATASFNLNALPFCTVGSVDDLWGRISGAVGRSRPFVILALSV